MVYLHQNHGHQKVYPNFVQTIAWTPRVVNNPTKHCELTVSATAIVQVSVVGWVDMAKSFEAQADAARWP